MYQAGLVLEGGGMKGIYTAGVLDFFLDKGIDFSSIYGVSAGAIQMCSFMSKQRGRARDISVDYLDMSDYCGVKSLITSGDLFNAKFCYEMIPDYLNPYDCEAFNEYRGKAYAVVTNIETGRPEYLRIRDAKKDLIAVRASASLPLVSRNVRIGKSLYLDGGIADSIPIRQSVMDGNCKNVVVMTKEKDYVRTPASAMNLALMKMRYIKYPKVYELMAKRHTSYNDTLKYMERLEQEGRAFIIRPSEKSDVGRIERDKEKMLKLYDLGYKDAQNKYQALLNYLEQ